MSSTSTTTSAPQPAATTIARRREVLTTRRRPRQHPEGAPVSRTPDPPGKGGRRERAPLGPHTAQILATKHWSLLATRSLIWNEAMSGATVLLTVLSASIIALALLADATGFGPQTSALALVPLPGCCFWTSPPTCAWCRPTPRSCSWCWP